MSRNLATLPQDVDEIITRTLNWVDDLNGSTISTVSWTVPAGLTNVTSSNTTTTSTIRISASTPGVYVVECTVTTAAAETLQASFTLTVTN